MENKGNTMKITYNKNPLFTTVELDENEKKELWYKIKIQEMEEILFSAHFYLEEKYFDLKRAKDDLDPDYYCNEEDNKKSKLDERCDMLLETFLSELQSNHIGDCTCVACSCMKCHAEGLLGIDTIKGLGKHTAHKIPRLVMFFQVPYHRQEFHLIPYFLNFSIPALSKKVLG